MQQSFRLVQLLRKKVGGGGADSLCLRLTKQEDTVTSSLVTLTWTDVHSSHNTNHCFTTGGGCPHVPIDVHVHDDYGPLLQGVDV